MKPAHDATPAESDIHNDGYTASYCPEDNKLRLYTGRVARSTYDVLVNAGYKSTPKQSCDFVATWSIRAEDLAFLLIPEDADIEDEDISPEERAADRAERFAGYRDKRRHEAGYHADRFEAGPDAHGFQNAARAERAAARHDRQRDKALCQWSKAEYWQSRTAGVISHALHRSDAATRRGRILEIEKEMRQYDKAKAEALERRNAWQAIADSPAESGADELLPLDDSGYNLTDAATPTQRKAYWIGNDGRCMTGWERPEAEANDEYRRIHRTEPRFSPYDLLTKNEFIRIPVKRWTPREVANEFLRRYIHPDEPTTGTNRKLEHLRNRLIYENAMLTNEGGQASEVEMVVGGWITYKNRWGSTPAGEYQITKINRSPATKRVTSVEIVAPRSIHRRGQLIEEVGPVRVNIERSGEDIYRAPSAEDVAAVTASKKAKKDATPTIPTINPTREDAQRLQDAWNAAALATGKTTKVVEVEEMTQAKFSHWLKHEYVHIEEVTIGGQTIKMRLARGGGFYDYHAAKQVIVLTDKPQKALPAIPAPAPAEPITAGCLF